MEDLYSLASDEEGSHVRADQPDSQRTFDVHEVILPYFENNMPRCVFTVGDFQAVYCAGLRRLDFRFLFYPISSILHSENCKIWQ